MRKRHWQFIRLFVAVLGFMQGLIAVAQLREDGVALSIGVLPLAGERFKTAQYQCWLPEKHGSLNGIIIHQHGCGELPATQSLTLILDTHWRALARKHGFALVAPSYIVERECQDWNDPANGSERALLAALDTLALQTHRPELTTAPWVLWGHSGGSSWVARMIMRQRKRILAVSLRGGVSMHFGDAEFRGRFVAVARDLPLLFVLGKGEALPSSKHHVSWGPMHTMSRELRQNGGLVALAVDPLTEHHCGNSRLLTIPFFDAILDAHSDNRKSPGVLIDTTTHRQLPMTPKGATNAGYIWLPSPVLARTWIEFSTTGSVVTVNPVKQRPHLAVEQVKDSLRVELTWQIEPGLKSGIRSVRIYRNDAPHKEIGVAPADFIAQHGDTPPAELQVSRWVDNGVRAGFTYAYTITFVNALGSESRPSKAVTIHL